MHKAGRTSMMVFAAVLVTGCAGSATSNPGFEAVSAGQPNAVTPVMLRHFDHARTLTSAAIFGRTRLAHESAEAMRREDPVGALPAETRSAYATFVSSIQAVERAEERAALAAAAADVARDCGDCHLAAGLGPTFTLGRPVEPVTPRDHLMVLAWGSTRLWESMVGGSDLAWRAGARALSGQRLREDLYASQVSDLAAARALGARLHDLGVEALSASDRDARAVILGEIWGTCSGCHELVGLGS